jgi:hypothetical protein
MEKIKELFLFFRESVATEVELSINELASIFANLVCGESVCADGVLSVGACSVSVDENMYRELLHKLCQLTEGERRLLLDHRDCLYEAVSRRRSGAFYTPAHLVAMSHNVLSAQLGGDWKDRYIVWDAAAGSRNLTKNHKFHELYSSTLDKMDVDTAIPNDNETIFQFDFLQDSDDKLPSGLLSALQENKPLLFYMNPPYSTGSGARSRGGRDSVKRSLLYSQMVRNGFNELVFDAYVQFLFRIFLYVKKYSLTNVVIGMFSPITHLSSPRGGAFRRLWCDVFSLQKAFLFVSSEFPECTELGAVSFSVWRSGKNESVSRFRHTCIKCKPDGSFDVLGKKDICNFDDGTRKPMTCDLLKTRAAFSTAVSLCVTFKGEVINPVKAKLCKSIRVPTDFLGSMNAWGMFSLRQRVPHFGRTFCVMYSSLGGDVHITPANFDKVFAAYSTYMSAPLTWFNVRDVLCVPNDLHSQWDEYVGDCVVWSLCHPRSFFMPKYNVHLNGKTYQLPNEFFWMSRSKMTELAEKYGNRETLRSLEVLPRERYLYQRVSDPSFQCTDDARRLLEVLGFCIERSFRFRQEYSVKYPQLSLNEWDSGWCQIIKIMEEADRDSLNYVRRLRQRVTKSLQERQYDLGWRISCTNEE